MPTTDEKNWAMAAHLGSLIASFVSGGLLQFVVPLVILLVKGGESRFVGHHARQSLNFQLSLFIAVIAYYAVALLLFFAVITIPLSFAFWCLGPVLFFMVEVGFCILATMKANAGENPAYPAIRFLSDPD